METRPTDMDCRAGFLAAARSFAPVCVRADRSACEDAGWSVGKYKIMARKNDRVTGIVIRNGQLLLIHRFREGNEYWVIPGGGVAEGEDFNAALRREMKEETGLEVISSRKLFDQLMDNGGKCVFYNCELEPGEPRLGGPESERQAAANQYHLTWIGINDLSTLPAIYPQPSKLIKILRDMRR